MKEGHTTKRGKILTMRNKHKNEYWKDAENRSFVEDNIKLFEFLTGRGFMIPTEGDIISGGRVVDSFTLMPAWIREQITVDGKKLYECDYTALHPNIAIHLYNGTESYISHQKMAKKASIDVSEVKIEHLSFFNKTWKGMQKSPIFKFYNENQPIMMENIRTDKRENGYKVTSRKMFKTEVEIMTDVITNLNGQGIEVLYVYDALLCEEKDREIVINAMNKIILEHGVKTSVKSTYPEKDETLPSKVLQYAITDEINLYEILPAMSFSVSESMNIITDLDRSVVQVKELVNYINYQIKQQHYNDYRGVTITNNHINLLQDMMRK